MAQNGTSKQFKTAPFIKTQTDTLQKTQNGSKRHPSNDGALQGKFCSVTDRDRYAYAWPSARMWPFETLDNSDNDPHKEIAPRQKAPPDVARFPPTDDAQAHRHALHCENSKARTGYIRPIIPASSYTPVNKPQTTFWRLDGRTKLDRLLQHEERDTKLRARVERIEEHLGKEEHMNEQQKREGTLEIQGMFLSKLAASENRLKELLSENRCDYIDGLRRPESSRWRGSRLDPEEKGDFKKLSKEIVDIIRMLH